MRKPLSASLMKEKISSWLSEQIQLEGTKGVIFGLSGGVDSAVVCGLSACTFPHLQCLALILPIHSDPVDASLASQVAECFHIKALTIDLSQTFDTLCSHLIQASSNGQIEQDEVMEKSAQASLKARLRMVTLHYYAKLLGFKVVGTSNKAELALGYFTKYGDSGVDLLPLGDLIKGEVYALAEKLGVPEKVRTRPPTAGLWPGQTDEGELGMTYTQIDRYFLEGSSGDREVDIKIKKMWEESMHKRSLPPMCCFQS